jgi:hypothetical protein
LLLCVSSRPICIGSVLSGGLSETRFVDSAHRACPVQGGERLQMLFGGHLIRVRQREILGFVAADQRSSSS